MLVTGFGPFPSAPENPTEALVTALVTKLRSGRLSSQINDAIGGATYTFDIWPSHPHRDEVLGLLREVRAKGVALRQKVEGYNAQVGLPLSEVLHSSNGGIPVRLSVGEVPLPGRFRNVGTRNEGRRRALPST